MTNVNEQVIEQARKNIELIIGKLRNRKEEIQLLTFTNGYEGIFLLKDDDWVKITGFNITARLGFEQAIRNPKTIDLLTLMF